MDNQLESKKKNISHLWDKFNKYKSIKKTKRSKKKDYVAATAVKNYLIKNPLIDWFKYHRNNTQSNEKQSKGTWTNSHYNLLFNQGLLFEDKVCKELKKKFSDNFIQIVDDPLNVKKNDKDKTLKAMLAGYYIIAQAPLDNPKNCTHGVADLLVRSDKMHKIFQNKSLKKEMSNTKAPNLNGNYHYVVVDIKWSKLPLCANGWLIRNDKLYPAYKGQLAIYNAALGLLQGYTPNKACILGKGYSYYEGKKLKTGYDCFDSLAYVDFQEFDQKYIQLTTDAINWVREVRYLGHDWDPVNPHRNEMYPNMCCQYNSQYHNIKKDLANTNNELTDVWNISINNRNKALEKGITQWSDENCTSEQLEVAGQNKSHIVNQILDTNRGDALLNPSTINNNDSDWQKKTVHDFYVDLEFTDGILYNEGINIRNSNHKNEMIFMIGVGYEENNNWNYRCFKINRYHKINEKVMIREFVQFINSKTQHPRFFHWGHADKTQITKANERHRNSWKKFMKSITWIDFYKVFTKEPITIKGVKKFRLKDIGCTMYDHRMIKTIWTLNNVCHGADALHKCIQYYKYIDQNGQSCPENEMIMDKIIRYNETDCQVVWDIIQYLRNNHTSK